MQSNRGLDWFQKNNAPRAIEWIVKGSVLGSPHEAGKFDKSKGQKPNVSWTCCIHCILTVFTCFDYFDCPEPAEGVPDADKNPSDASRLWNWQNSANLPGKDWKTLKSLLFSRSSSASSCIKIQQNSAELEWGDCSSRPVRTFMQHLGRCVLNLVMSVASTKTGHFVRWSCGSAKVCCQTFPFFEQEREWKQIRNWFLSPCALNGFFEWYSPTLFCTLVMLVISIIFSGFWVL